ncbi:B12-binding domain-containing radical SAM protein [Alkaliphilus serpentinus]|uniref:B12-binding domain-containing radical SAM protein n=1 Tax=Alkaliphilus serpentinus TaxID=1482731 RepID=A0A833HPA8_9FIRM|nr:radical SAM protein [Alkaliphilus serpentinus]KAB3530509.1 B12-binding domain-containing radical SAM protein [Alkaliphilus serpentinus]
MKITIIKVGMFEGKGYDALKPLIFPIIAELTPKNIELEFLDDRVETLPESLNSNIIALSFDTFSAKRAYILARRYKRPNNIIVLGGFHASLLKEEAKAYGDVIIVGDAEDTWPRLIEDALKGTLQPEYRSSSGCTLGYIDFNHPAFGGKKYQRLGVVQFSRGCKFGCDFCSIKALYPGKVRQKEINLIIEEIKTIKEKILFFVDDNLFLDEETAIALFRAIKPLKKKWACQISMDVAMNNKLLKLMRESGCVMVLIGFESLNKNNLTTMKKSANLAMDNYQEAIDNIYNHGLLIYATFVLGYDEDTIDSFEEILAFAMNHRFTVANFNPLIPMPGTPLYSRLEGEGRLIHEKWWLSNSYCYGDTAYIPRELAPEALMEGCKSLRYRFYGFKNIIKRLFANRLHLRPYNFFLYLALNIISNREIHRKQGRLLGGIIDEVSTD